MSLFARLKSLFGRKHKPAARKNALRQRRTFLESLEDRRLMVATPARFDFGPAGQTLASGYTAVAHDTAYTTTLGYGWTTTGDSGQVSNDQGTADALRTDFVRGFQPNTFKAALPYGTYDIVLTDGHDQFGTFDTQVSLDGTVIDEFDAPAGAYQVRTYSSQLIDSELELGLESLAPTNAQWRINGLTVTPSALQVNRVDAGSAAYNEGDSSIHLLPSVTVLNPDGTFNGGSLTVTNVGSTFANDRLEILHSGNGAGQIGVTVTGSNSTGSYGTVSFGGTQIATFAGGAITNATGSTVLHPLTITFNASGASAVSSAAVQALYHAVQYRNLNVETLATGSRTIQFAVADGDGASTTVSRGIAVKRNIFDGGAIATSYNEDLGPVLLLSSVNIVDMASSFNGGSLTLSFAGTNFANDRLAIQPQGTGVGEIGLSGSDVTYAGNVIGTIVGNNASTGFTVTLTTSYATREAVQALVRRVSFECLNTFNPSIADRPVLFELTDGLGQGSRTHTVQVLLSNDPPQLSLGSAVAYTERSTTPQLIASSATLGDDNSVFASGNITVAFSGASDSQATLAVQSGDLVSVSSGVVSYNGAAVADLSGGTSGSPLVVTFRTNLVSGAAAQAILRKISYVSTNSHPAASYTLNVTVNDTGLSTSANKTVTVTPVNDAPSISDLQNQTIAESSSTGALAFTIADVETDAASLTLSGSSSNPALVPNGNIVFGGSGGNRTVSVTPAAGFYGSATITIMVSDGALSASDTFVLTVTADPNNTSTAIITAGADAKEEPTAANRLGTFTISRRDVTNLGQALSVNYTSTIVTGITYNYVAGTFTQSPGPSTSLGSSGTVTIPANVMSVQLQFDPVNYNVRDAVQQLTVTLGGDANNAATIDIEDNDDWTVSAVGTSAAYEAGPTPGVFTISRTGETDLTHALDVRFEAVGNPTLSMEGYFRDPAGNMLTAHPLGGLKITIPSQAESIDLQFMPYDDGEPESIQYVTIELKEDPSRYALPAATTATIEVYDNDYITVGATDGSASEEGPDQGRFTITRQGDPTYPLTVEFHMKTHSGQASASDYTLVDGNNVTLNGSVTILAGNLSAHVYVRPIDDSLEEGIEMVTMALGLASGSPSSVYTVGNPASAYLTLNDNDVQPQPAAEVVIQSAEWQDPDGNWIPAEPTEVLWVEDALRWVAVPVSASGAALTGTTWFQRTFGSSYTWAQIGSSTTNVLESFAGTVGDWEFKVVATFADESEAESAPRHWPIDDILKTEWYAGDAEQEFFDGQSTGDFGVFPEATAPVGDEDRRLLNEVAIAIQLAMKVPEGFIARRYAKVFDPDHAFDLPTPAPANAEEKAKLLGFDSNDKYDVTGANATHAWDDNRPGGGGAQLSKDVIVFYAGDDFRYFGMKINSRQPGNDFKFASRARKRDIDITTFDEADGKTLLMQSGENSRAMPASAQTGTLTVWRHLHLELDSMEDPTEWDPASPTTADDVEPAFPKLPTTTQLSQFERANIRPVSDLEEWDLDNTVPFIHNFELDSEVHKATASEAFEVLDDADFWVAHVVMGYETYAAFDFDPNEGAVFYGHNFVPTDGLALPDAIIYSEVIRDKHAALDAITTEDILDYETCLALTVLHEIAHMYIGGHARTSGGITNEGPLRKLIMNFAVEDYAFTPRQLGAVQNTITLKEIRTTE